MYGFDFRTLGAKLFAWYDATRVNGFGAALPADTAAVAQWNDLSDNVRHLAEATNQPTFRKDAYGPYRHAVRFDGVNDILSVAVAGAFARPITVVLVAKNLAADDGERNFLLTFNADRIGLTLDWLTDNRFEGLDDTTGQPAGPAGDATTLHIFTLGLKGASSPSGTVLSVDGTHTRADGQAGTNTNGNIDVGGSGTAAQFTNCDVCEIAILTDEYPLGFLYGIEQMLAAKWGVIGNYAHQK